MSNYAVFFGYNHDKNVFRLPTNPEHIEVSSSQAIEMYEILKLGQIAIPGELELKEYSFECEFPSAKAIPFSPVTTVAIGIATALGLSVEKYKAVSDIPNYVETSSNFQSADYYLQRFEFWRDKKVPFRFIAGRTDAGTKDTMEDDSINSLCLIEELSIVEKAGEEGDKYVSFKLIEYREYGKKSVVVKTDKKAAKKSAKKKTTAPKVSAKSSGTYVVKSGDSLWSIAKKLYGDGSKNNIIYNANKSKIKNPNMITDGQKLKIPTESEFSKYSAPLPVMKTEKAEKAGAVKTYTYVSDKPLAGISLTLENGSYSYSSNNSSIRHDSGTSLNYHSHSGGGRSF